MINLWIVKYRHINIDSLYDMTRELKMEINSGDQITLRAANSGEITVNGAGSIWLDLYEGKYETNNPSSRKMIDVIISESLDGDEDLLLSCGSMYKLFLLPQNWPFCSDDT